MILSGVAIFFSKTLTTFLVVALKGRSKTTKWTTSTSKSPPPCKKCPIIDSCSACGVHLQIFPVNYANDFFSALGCASAPLATRMIYWLGWVAPTSVSASEGTRLASATQTHAYCTQMRPSLCSRLTCSSFVLLKPRLLWCALLTRLWRMSKLATSHMYFCDLFVSWLIDWLSKAFFKWPNQQCQSTGLLACCRLFPADSRYVSLPFVQFQFNSIYFQIASVKAS